MQKYWPRDALKILPRPKLERLASVFMALVSRGSKTARSHALLQFGTIETPR